MIAGAYSENHGSITDSSSFLAQFNSLQTPAALATQANSGVVPSPLYTMMTILIY